MKIKNHRWWVAAASLFALLNCQLPLSSAAENSIYHHNIDGQDINLKEWYHEHQDRCYSFDNPKKNNTHITDIRNALRYLGREKTYVPHLLAQAKYAGTSICVDNRADGTRGYYDYKYNVIAVREGLSFMEKTAIILHELRHVDHVLGGYRLTLDYAMDEIVRLTFAVEADVQAYTALVAWRLMVKGDNRLWETLLGFKHYRDIAQTFAISLKHKSSENQAALAAFEQWYRSDWRKENYYKGCCTGYLDMLDETKKIEQYTKLPADYFDHLCQLPTGSNYGCHKTTIIKQNF